MHMVEVAERASVGFPWFAWVALAAIFCGTLTSIMKMWLQHRERIAMIRCGIDPDAPHRKPVFDDVDA